jgi:hypothetical protein
MSTDRQIAANRQNARKGTGPRTLAGKAISSGNARRHGLTGALNAKTVQAWYRVLVEDATAEPDPFSRDPCLIAAADLARAEANLQRVRHAEERWHRGCGAPRTRSEKELVRARDLLETLLQDARSGRRRSVIGGEPLLREPFRGRPDLPSLVDRLEEHERTMTVSLGWDQQAAALLGRIDRMIECDGAERQRKQATHGRMLVRYRASAEAQRHKALRRWAEEIAKRSQSTAAA